MRRKSILAGIIIGIAGFIYTMTPNNICGSLLFSFGLISILILKLNLYTGQIAYINKTNFIKLFTILVYNIIGAMIIGVLLCPLISEKVELIAINKINNPLYNTLINSICCGFCIYIAVESYKKTQSIINIILPVMVFILSGFDHCIANIFYFTAASISPIMYYKHFIICVIGNSIGSIIMYNLTKGEKNDL